MLSGLARGRRLGGRVHSRGRGIRQDYAFDLNWGIRGLLGLAIDDTNRVADAYRALAPFSDLLAGAGSAVLVIAPIAEILGDLAAHQGNSALALDHYSTAITLAQRVGAPHWEARAASAARRLA